jgi:acyl-CoA synthetase (AMP-forming)/AMP-acid ligase II
MVLNKLSEYGSRNKIKLHTLKCIISAGAPVHRNVLESFSQLISEDARIHIPYGATEALPVTEVNVSGHLLPGSPDNENETGISIGYPVTGLDVKIIEISDRPILSWKEVIQMAVNEVGEIVVKGPWVTTKYFNNPDATRLAKICDPADNRIWHRMGDLGRIDEDGKVWFYGRKSQRVITPGGTMFTIPCEAVFNRHPSVVRSALVGIPDRGTGHCNPVICIQPEKGVHATGKLVRELLELGDNSKLTKGIQDILFFDNFPVDPRHNAKIFREKLAKWAITRIR